MALDICVRSYSTSDWKEVCRIHDAVRPQELALGRVDGWAFRPMAEAADADEFFASETLVACLDDDVAGFISWNGSYITWLYVAREYQRRGIGRRLLEKAMERIGPEAWTSLLAGNEPALVLYLQAGMEVVWTRDSECDGYACQAMRLALPGSRMRDPEARR